MSRTRGTWTSTPSGRPTNLLKHWNLRANLRRQPVCLSEMRDLSFSMPFATRYSTTTIFYFYTGVWSPRIPNFPMRTTNASTWKTWTKMSANRVPCQQERLACLSYGIADPRSIQMRTENCLQWDGRPMCSFEKTYISLPIQRPYSEIWKTSAGTQHDQQSCNWFHLWEPLPPNHSVEWRDPGSCVPSEICWCYFH